MFKVNVGGEPKYMVQLVGPRSYRMGGLKVMRGGTVTVALKTRNYLVKTLNGAFIDYDPTPAVPVDEILPPQFGEKPETMIDMSDLDGKENPALTQEQAAALAAGGSEVDSAQAAFADMTVAELRVVAANAGVSLVGISIKADIVAALSAPSDEDDAGEIALGAVTPPADTGENAGDLTGSDLPSPPAKGGATKTAVKVKGTPTGKPVKAGAQSIS